MKSDTIVAILVVIVITDAMVAFVWWRSLLSTQHPDRARAMLVISDTQPRSGRDLGSGARKRVGVRLPLAHL